MQMRAPRRRIPHDPPRRRNPHGRQTRAPAFRRRPFASGRPGHYNQASFSPPQHRPNVFSPPAVTMDWTRALFEAIDDAVFIHDADGNILDANPAACRRLGYTRDELLRLNTRD